VEKIRVGYPVKGWTKELIEGWNVSFDTLIPEVELDLSEVGFVTLLDWLTIVAMIEKVLANPYVKTFHIDVKGTDPSNFIPLAEFIDIEKNLPSRRFPGEISLSKRIYKSVGFIESLGTLDILNRKSEEGKVSYPGINIEDVKKHQFYTRKKGDLGVLLGLTRIQSKEDCTQFTDDRSIRNWIQTMSTRYHESPLFETQEVWRVLCLEFAVNIYEHAGIPGFISMRVVSPRDNKGTVHPWCRETYPSPYISRLFDEKNNPGNHFLEICIGDAGRGFIETLKTAYINHMLENKIPVSKDNAAGNVRNEDIVAFAFDELGTCKDANECWITERHALNRILHITAQYGGVLVVRTGGVELIYSGEGEMFRKSSTGRGYIPTQEKEMAGSIPGAQFQVILPLIPFTSTKKISRVPSLSVFLPSTFHTESKHVRGHLVPLLEKLDQPNSCIGKEELGRFRRACENLCKELLTKRPAAEPLILDFSLLNWTAGQFETLLHFLQNILQHRPVLLVEIEPKLAREVIRLESMGAPTTLDKDLIFRHLPKEGPYYTELSGKEFLETYNRIHVTVLGIDWDGKYYIFGLRNHAYEDLLLSLIETPKSIENLCNETMWDEPLKANTLKAILNYINPIFYQNEKGQWQTVWDRVALSVEAQRVMPRHFDKVAKRSQAWRGYPYETEKSIFKIPWQKRWRSNFLEKTRILSRERHADEVAQRLIYRLQKGLTLRGKSLRDVKVLACMTAPAMLLASFIYRWWPSQYERPAVSDLGYYVMLSHPGDLPSLVKTGGIVIVCDIMDTGTLSGKLINALKQQGMDILCMLSFINMIPSLKKTKVNPIEMGWKPGPGESEEGFIPKHALICVNRPDFCDPPRPYEKDRNTFWIEPRTMLPIKYTSLKRQFKLGQDPDLDRRNRYLERFDRSSNGCLFAAGHFVYGHRHFSVSIDVQKVLTREIGDEIAVWVADICENLPGRQKGEWESEMGHNLKGDVTAVLMPLHSQVHYIWPKVEKILAQRGRRHPTWLLDATLFVGSGPVYRIPQQFQHQIRMSIQETIAVKQGKQNEMTKPIRLLILDDAIITARTAQTILERINRFVKELNTPKVDDEMDTFQNPIEWIRYFCIHNQMSNTLHMLWKNLSSIGETKIKFVFEAYAPFMGVPVYSDNDCPTCRDIVRLKSLAAACEQYGIDSALQWTEMRLTELQSIAIDSPGFNSSSSVSLNRGIEILKRDRDKEMDTSSSFFQVHAATAIWRFYELMYYSYPPEDVLLFLKDAWGNDSEGSEVKKEYERYRWAVFEWCLRNWKRLEANTAVDNFILEVKREVENNTTLVKPLLEGCAQHFEDPAVTRLISDCINTLAELESKRISGDEGAEPGRINHTINLYTALALFWLNIPRARWEELSYESQVQGKSEKIPLIDHLDKSADRVDIHGLSLLRNLHRQLIRPQRHTDPKWALDTIAESLFRGRDPLQSKHGRHHLLPKLISEILKGSADNEDRLLLHSSLTIFLAALEELLHYDYELSFDTHEVQKISCKVLEWLKNPAASSEGNRIPRQLIDLRDALDLDGPFIQKFNRVFHEEVEGLRSLLEKRVKEIGKGFLTFEYTPDQDTGRCRILIPGSRLQMCLANLTIDPIVKFQAQHKSRIKVSRVQADEGKETICFRLLTNFSSLEETQRVTREGQNLKVDRSMLEMFGAEFDDHWQPPLPAEKEEGFTASYQIKIPSGFMPGR
jgi:hypothetical protein